MKSPTNKPINDPHTFIISIEQDTWDEFRAHSNHTITLNDSIVSLIEKYIKSKKRVMID